MTFGRSADERRSPGRRSWADLRFPAIVRGWRRGVRVKRVDPLSSINPLMFMGQYVASGGNNSKWPPNWTDVTSAGSSIEKRARNNYSRFLLV
ncbi:Hypothetical protein NTJ_06066 [Nesidiocoris tenuis]|uniref:Uncharacterized protein n=1 Tax=Nesidiocoris tenuis TaxID=355587 RepID=A0ABN7APM8_9HEMI|nr:Hypothetical protein NTJ_06066 [Nesidiocoris tenuis]